MIGGATDEEIAEHAARPRPTRPAAVRHLQRTRLKPKNGKMRAGKNINDAAEALLGMGSGFVDDDLMVGSMACRGGCIGFPAVLLCMHELWQDVRLQLLAHAAEAVKQRLPYKHDNDAASIQRWLLCMCHSASSLAWLSCCLQLLPHCILERYAQHQLFGSAYQLS